MKPAGQGEFEVLLGEDGRLVFAPAKVAIAIVREGEKVIRLELHQGPMVLPYLPSKP